MIEDKTGTEESISADEAADVIEGEVAQSENGEEKTANDLETTLEEQLKIAKEEAAINLDGWQRAQAEFANARKRLEKQRAEIYISSHANLAAKLLPAIDDFERAIDNAPVEISENDWFAGIGLIHRKMIGILEAMDVKPIQAVGEEFDPNYHEALSMEPSEEYESGIVIRELQRGYKMGNRVVRPSLVNIAA